MTLFIEIERPNRLHVYQGPYRMCSFSDGEADLTSGFEMPLFLHAIARGGLDDLWSRIVPPKHEPPREYDEFQFMAMWNCFAAIINEVAASGHGGAVIVVPARADAESPYLRRKYAMHTADLSDAFVEFINARHEVGNEYYRRDMGVKVSGSRLARLNLKLKSLFDTLVERIGVVARLAQCDGAVMLSRSLEVLGFGVEIAAELRRGMSVYDVVDEFRGRNRVLDVEQFGMRHRSAVKFASHCTCAVVLVASQDGPISAVWADANGVYVKKGVRLVNANIPWA
ncbi:hypothetical protein WMF18_41820 [Sorangium sp. So ce315]|uniref:hypothetical protein n=1 Tax=Sorangium sp. So ce315 TaxID=3133299 RepID=UPI003F5F3890